MVKSILKFVISSLPQNAISRVAGNLGRSSLSRYMISPFSYIYNVNAEEMEKPLTDYPNFLSFFTRRLKANARQISLDPRKVISPVDGRIAQFGEIHEGAVIQAKGINYRVEELLGCKPDDCGRYEGGNFMTIYLSPRDYHRIHMPLSGNVKKATYLPGRLFPVNSIGVNHVHGLFTKNERLITYADTDAGEVAIVKVGAFIVGSVQVHYGEHRTNVKKGKAYTTPLKDTFYSKGDEIGFFEFGSTVILLFEKNRVIFDKKLKLGDELKYGEEIGEIF